ncbi:hypothetical protein C8R44DRAFT_931580 [Mycena epipterygia]|nr:hypothetical protein C8R44DRAFT_931580 [Mycena epipterygia]
MCKSQELQSSLGVLPRTFGNPGERLLLIIRKSGTLEHPVSSQESQEFWCTEAMFLLCYGQNTDSVVPGLILHMRVLADSTTRITVHRRNMHILLAVGMLHTFMGASAATRETRVKAVMVLFGWGRESLSPATKKGRGHIPYSGVGEGLTSRTDFDDSNVCPSLRSSLPGSASHRRDKLVPCSGCWKDRGSHHSLDTDTQRIWLALRNATADDRCRGDKGGRGRRSVAGPPTTRLPAERLVLVHTFIATRTLRKHTKIRGTSSAIQLRQWDGNRRRKSGQVLEIPPQLLRKGGGTGFAIKLLPADPHDDLGKS